MSQSTPETHPLHAAVLKSDEKALEAALSTDGADLDAVDHHGNTALHLACMLRATACAKLLVDAGASAKKRSVAAWSPYDESISNGDRELVGLLLKRRREESEAAFRTRTPQLLQKIEEMPDFSIEMSWEFTTWIPLLGRLLPRDTWLIQKCGRQLRIDTTLRDFRGMSWQRGNLSYLVSERQGKLVFVEVDRDEKTYEINETKLVPDEKKSESDDDDDDDVEDDDQGDDKDNEDNSSKSAMDVDEDGAPRREESAIERRRRRRRERHQRRRENTEEIIDELLSHDISNTFVDEDKISFERVRTGFPGWRYDKVESVGGYEAKVFEVKEASLRAVKRQEHLTEEDIRRNERKKTHFMQNTGAALKGVLTKHDEDACCDGDEEDTDEDETTSCALAIKETDTEGNETKGKKDAKDAYVVQRESLPPPPRPSQATVDAYFSAEANPLDQSTWYLGRPMRLKENTTAFKATLAMADDFPVPLTDILPLLEIMANTQSHAERLRQFLSGALPPGFPVKIEIPLIATVQARICFTNFSNGPQDESFFAIPDGFRRVVTMPQNK